MGNHRILAIDSGVGGLSIVREMRSHLPTAEFCYLADNAAFPYGGLTDAEVAGRLLQIAPVAVAKIDPDLVVIACNTASTAALDKVRSLVGIPVVGVVPAIKPAAESSVTKSIALIATPTTIASAYTQRLVAEFAPHCQLVQVGSSQLVALAESKLRGQAVDLIQVRQELAPLFAAPSDLDRLVLGCTHFPLLKEEFTKVLPNSIKLVDSGEAIARRVKQLLAATDSIKPRLGNRFYFTQPVEDGKNIYLADFGFDEVLSIKIELDQISQISGTS